jgi:ABC-2 type transport system ATP-binding protein
MSLLVINKLTKYYGDFKALDQVSLTINPNEIYGFLGKNGAGKTTTINSILGLIKYDEGEVFFFDKKVTYQDIEYKKHIGYVPDVPSFPSYFTPKEFLRLMYDFFGLPNDKKTAKIEEVLRFVDLAHSDKKIGSFSRGMKQRLAIAQALLHDPILLIMDEPTSALDPIGRKAVLDIIKKLKAHMTIFYSTHILEDAQKVCDRIALIDQGKIILEDTIDKVLKNKQTVEYFVQTKESPDYMVNLFSEFDYFEEVKPYQEGLIFTLNPSKKLHDFLAFCVQYKVEIIGLNKQEKSLEDVFIEVLHENNH